MNLWSMRSTPAIGTAMLMVLVAMVSLSACTNQPIVNGDGSVAVEVGDVRLTGGPGSVSGSAITVTPATMPPEDLGPLSGPGAGINVSIGNDTRLDKPLTLSWDAPSPVPHAVPIVAHGREDTWEYLAPEWDGQVASVTTSDFSPRILGWFDVSRQATKVRDWIVQQATGHITQQPCEGKPKWVEVDTVADIVQVCATERGKQAAVTVTSQRDFWTQIDLSDSREIAVEGQFEPLREVLAKLMGYKPDRTVMLPPGGRLSFLLERAAEDVTVRLGARVTERATAMNALDSFMTLIGFDTRASAADPAWEILALCGKDLLQEAIRDSTAISPSAIGSLLTCEAVGGVQNLSKPEVALRAARDLYRGSLDAKTLEEQATRLSKTAERLLNAGVILRAVSAVNAARDAMIASWGPLSDAVQELATKGTAAAILVTAKADPDLGLTSPRQLLNATIPSTCDHPGGKLKNGHLGSRSDGGGATLDVKRTALGSLVPGGAKGAVATISCSQGGVAWNDYLVFYDPQKRIVGHYDTADLSKYGGRTSVSQVSFKNQIATVRAIGVAQKGDNDLWGSMGVRMTFGYDATTGEMKLRDTRRFPERATAESLATAVMSGNRAAAATHTTAQVVSELSSYRANARSMRIKQCSGPFSDAWYASNIEAGQRGCELWIEWKTEGPDAPYSSVFLLILDHPSSSANWTTWKVVSAQGIAG